MAVARAWGNLTPSSSSSPDLKHNSYYSCFGKKDCTYLSFTGSRNTRNSSLYCRCTSHTCPPDWDWNRWKRHFTDMEQAQTLVSLLKLQLEDAIEKEDFQEAAKLKKAIAEATLKDTVAEIMFQLKNALDEERYHDASMLCKLTGSGLVGWWVGYSEDNNPFGRVVRITPGVGRFVASSYTPRQLVTASSGTPLFEIFVSKEADQTYTMQVVFLQRAKGSSPGLKSPPSSLQQTNNPLTPTSENSSKGSSSGSEESSAEGSGLKGLNTKDGNNIVDASEEGLKSVINYLKEKMPGSKFKILNANVQKEVSDDNESMEQLTDDNEEPSSPDDLEDDTRSHNDIHRDGTQLGGDTETTDEGKHVATKLFIGGILHNKEDTPSKDDYVRLAAEIKDMERDSFVLHVPSKNKDNIVGETLVSTTELETFAAQSVSELMPFEVAKALMGVDKHSSKVSKSFQDVFKNIVSKKNGLSRITSFSRITNSQDDFDPFEGLYVGAFGPLGAELVQLRRKFGQWHGESELPDVEFFEYVEAVKLTGDLNVPAGQVTFRAKIGKGSRNSNHGKYPSDLGVVASYRGQGKVADVGFQNSRWVDGELLQLSGKGMWPYIGGADLGFLYVVPEKSFLVLLNRLKLPE